MKTKGLTLAALLILPLVVYGQDILVGSPDGKLEVHILNGEKLQYSVLLNGKTIIETSAMGFLFKDEEPMTGNFIVKDQSVSTVDELWDPVVRSKHAEVRNNFTELKLLLKEKSGAMRELGVEVRAYNDGAAFRYRLFRGGRPGDRQVTRELTAFTIPGDPKAWVVEYGGYSTSNESEFMERRLSYVNEKTVAGLPMLMQYDSGCWIAITEAKIDNYAAFYLGTTGKSNQLTTKLVPLPGESEDGVRVRFADEVYTPWRVIMAGEAPGKLIESEIIQNLNDPCMIKDPSWIRPGMSAWDHWWSGEVKMEMPVIKQYIDLASAMGWPYMLVDWQWYGQFNSPEADITKWAPQISMPEIISYAASKNVRIIVWLYSTDVNRNSAYKTAFPLYKAWGVAGVKIDFMDRDDQQMVNWYHDIIKCAADNRLLVDFHGAYKPDGIIRTWPNMITREGLMGNEYYKFSDRMSPEHNVKLAFTRMLAGQMDYTPGAFLNVTRAKFRQQTPAVVWNTRAAELSKFVIYESPLTVVCDHPDNILNQPGADFLKLVPTIWDDTRFIGGYPGSFIALARKSGDSWFVGIMNNSAGKTVSFKADFLQQGAWEAETWSDGPDAGKKPVSLKKSVRSIKPGEEIKANLAVNGGYVMIIRAKQKSE